MPIEIKEIVVKATIDNGPSGIGDKPVSQRQLENALSEMKRSILREISTNEVDRTNRNSER